MLPGGGFTDPPEDDSASGFGYWGGYVPPIGHEKDPWINPSTGTGFAAEGSAVSRSVMQKDGIRVETFTGIAPGGYSVAGLVSLGMTESLGGEQMLGPDRPAGPHP